VGTVRKIDIGILRNIWGTQWRGWLGHCARSRKVAGSIFSLTYSFWPHYGSGVDSASNRDKYQKCLLGVKDAGA